MSDEKEKPYNCLKDRQLYKERINETLFHHFVLGEDSVSDHTSLIEWFIGLERSTLKWVDGFIVGHSDNV